MKPKPFCALKNFTVPTAIMASLHFPTGDGAWSGSRVHRETGEHPSLGGDLWAPRTGAEQGGPKTWLRGGSISWVTRRVKCRTAAPILICMGPGSRLNVVSLENSTKSRACSSKEFCLDCGYHCVNAGKICESDLARRKGRHGDRLTGVKSPWSCRECLLAIVLDARRAQAGQTMLINGVLPG